MKAVLLALLFLGSVLFFRADGTKVASIFKWKLPSRARLDEPLMDGPLVTAIYVYPLDRKRVWNVLSGDSQGNNQRINLKNVVCKLPMCTVQELTDKLNQWTDPAKDISDPKHTSISGYGRRRRSFAIPLVQG